MDYKKLHDDLLAIFQGKSYMLTFDYENTADAIIKAVKDQLEPKVEAKQ